MPHLHLGENILHRHRRGDAVSKPDNRHATVSHDPMRQHSLSIEDVGADIPDIPLRRQGPVAAGTSPTPWEDDGSNWVPPGPVSPRVLHSRRKPSQHFQHREVPLRGRVISPDPDYSAPRGAQSLSPPPKSAPTRSTRSRANSTRSSYETNATSLVPLQTKGLGDDDLLEPIPDEELEPGSFELVAPDQGISRQHSLETRSEVLFSKEHLKGIFSDYMLLQKFTDFLADARRESLPLLTYYLDSMKALRAIAYANAISRALDATDGHDFTSEGPGKTINTALEKKAEAAFEALTREDLPAYITHLWTQTVSVSIKRRITGTLPVQLREMSEGLAEVFCLTDPSRRDNPIVFASEEFYRTTQYGMNYVIGRNCRFLQGPKTNPFSVQRIRDKLLAGKECYETFLNYRRDGSPFMNLLMMAPLYDSRGTIRYFIGAQVDVSGLVKESSGLDAMKKLMAEYEAKEPGDDADHNPEEESKDEFKDLCEMFNSTELETVRRCGGDMYRVKQEEADQSNGGPTNWNKPRILLREESLAAQGQPPSPTASSGRLTGIYSHYLLVRPYPSLRILFASPSLRVPGILQSPFMSKIGGSDRVREGLTQAFADGYGVTAKIRWSSKPGVEGRPRWIHCTPLVGSNGAVGVWMVVLVDDEVDPLPRHMQAPAVRVQRRRTSQPPTTHNEDNMSLRSFAAMNRDPEASTVGDARPGSRGTWGTSRTDRPETPYTLRLGDE
ncbi:Phototropin like protein [Verticillium longisporum]|uniref:Phototropin like protein n=1 Tax=Verticillium longisporum TaxID=100787 RepID=A0A8I2ZF69_VERLO|nr:Phototropin like protein [Verticillium longisporum]